MFPQLGAIETEIHDAEVLLKQKSQKSSLLLQASSQVESSLGAIEIGSLEVHQGADLPVGEVIPSVDAVGWVNGHRNVDIRPRLVDSSSGEARLIDSGAQLSATMKKQGDKLDQSVNLVAVNGSRIPTYGIRNIELKIGRKAYRIPAIICDVKQDILGFDFVTKYKLNLEWDEFDPRPSTIRGKNSYIVLN